MLDELNTAINDYWTKWQALVAARQNKTFFESLKPTAAAWKVADRAEYDRMCGELHDQSDHIIETWMNGRWVAKFLLRDAELNGGIKIVKVMQRRPGSDDPLGFDHVDFYGPSLVETEEVLTQEKNLNWTRESNDSLEGYGWLSVWFEGGPEAKLRDDTVIDIITIELQQLKQKRILEDV